MEIKHKLKNGFVLIGCVSPKRKSRRRRNKDKTETETQQSPTQKNAKPTTKTVEPAPLQTHNQNWAQLTQQAQGAQPKKLTTNNNNRKKSKRSARRQKNTKTVQAPPALIRKIPPPALTRRLPTRTPSKGGYKARRIVHTYDEKDVDMTRNLTRSKQTTTNPTLQEAFPTLQEANKQQQIHKSSLKKAGGYRAARVATAYDPNYESPSKPTNNRFNNANSNNYSGYNRNYNNNYTSSNSYNNFRNNSPNNINNNNNNFRNFSRPTNNFSRPNNNFSRPNNNSNNNDSSIVTKPGGLSSRSRGFKPQRVPAESVRPSYVSSNRPSNSGYRTPPKTPPRTQLRTQSRQIIRRNTPKTPPKRMKTPPRRMKTPPQRNNTRPKPIDIPTTTMNTRPEPINIPTTAVNTRPEPKPKPKPKPINTRPKPTHTRPKPVDTPPKWTALNTQVDHETESKPKPKSKNKHKHRRKSKQKKQLPTKTRSKTPRSAKKNIISALDQNEKTKKYLELRKQRSLSYHDHQNTFIIKKNDHNLHDMASIKSELVKLISCNEEAASNEYYYNKNDMLHYVTNKDFETLNDQSVQVSDPQHKIKSSAESFNPNRKNISIATTSIPNISRTTSAPTPTTTSTYNNYHKSSTILPNVYSPPDMSVFENARRAASAADILNQQFQFVTTAPVTQATQVTQPITPQSMNHFGSQPMLQFNTSIQNQAWANNEVEVFEQSYNNENNFNNFINNIMNDNYDESYNENSYDNNGGYNNSNENYDDDEDEGSYSYSSNVGSYNGNGSYRRRWGRGRGRGRGRKYYNNKWNKYKSNRYKKNWYNWSKNRNRNDESDEDKDEDKEVVFVYQKGLDFRVLPKWCQHNNITTLFKCGDGYGDIEYEERESELLDGNLYFNFLCSAESDRVYEYLGFKEIIFSQIYFLNKSIRKRVHDTAPLLLQSYCFL